MNDAIIKRINNPTWAELAMSDFENILFAGGFDDEIISISDLARYYAEDFEYFDSIDDFVDKYGFEPDINFSTAGQLSSNDSRYYVCNSKGNFIITKK